MGPAAWGCRSKGIAFRILGSLLLHSFPGEAFLAPHRIPPRTASPQPCQNPAPVGINTSMMLTFWEWLGQGYEFGFVQELQRLIREMRGDEGYQAFIDQT